MRFNAVMALALLSALLGMAVSTTAMEEQNDDLPCDEGGTSCGDELLVDLCNMLVCDEAKKECVPKPLAEGTVCSAEGGDDDYFTLCNEGPGVCKTINTENGPQGRCFGKPSIGKKCDDFNECTGPDMCEVTETLKDRDKLATCKGKFLIGEPCENAFENQCVEDKRCFLPEDRDEPQCVGKVLQGKACNDYDPCTKDSVCVLDRFLEQPGEIGVANCKGVFNPSGTCSDIKPCTVNDRCEDSEEFGPRCVGDEVVNVSCNDGLECTTNDMCSFSEDFGYSICEGEPVDGCDEPPLDLDVARVDK